MSNAKQLAEDHWNGYVGPMMETMMKCAIEMSRFHYITSHVHGSKHGKEEQSEAPQIGGKVSMVTYEEDPVPKDDNPAPFAFIVHEVMAEVNRATDKYPKWPTDPLHALAVLGEEYGELNKGLLQLCYEPHKTNKSEVRAEAIQTAAMALRLIVSLDRYEYREGAQHKQEEENGMMDCAGIRCDQCDKKAACSVK